MPARLKNRFNKSFKKPRDEVALLPRFFYFWTAKWAVTTICAPAYALDVTARFSGCLGAELSTFPRELLLHCLHLRITTTLGRVAASHGWDMSAQEHRA